MPDFGDKFKSARASKGESLEDCAQKTRIGARFLRAIEEEAFQVLPGGLFNRGFIRTYAKHVGLDPNVAVLEYQERVGGSVVDNVDPEQNLPPVSSESRIFPVAVGSLLALIVLFYAFVGDPETPVEARLEAPVTTTEQTAVLGRREVAVRTETAQTAVVSRRDAAPPAPPTPPAVVEASPIPVEPVSEEPPQTASVLPAPADDENVNVQIDVHDDTWLTVNSDGRELVAGVVMTPGTTRRYSATEAIEMRIGNAAGLTLSINGREVGRLGSDGQVRVLTITPGNASSFTGG